MKKGQKVRILRTNQIATIVEVELIRKGGKVHRYCHLKVDKKPDLWLDSSELGGMKETEIITFKSESGKEAMVTLTMYYDTGKSKVNISAVKPDSLMQHIDGGAHGLCVLGLIKGLKLLSDEPEE